MPHFPCKVPKVNVLHWSMNPCLITRTDLQSFSYNAIFVLYDYTGKQKKL